MSPPVTASADIGGVTQDSVLGERLQIRQPSSGYRIAIDPILLAASLTPAAGETIVDAGCGVGTAALCLAARCDGCRVVGVDADADLIRLATENAAVNGLSERVHLLVGDILTLRSGDLPTTTQCDWVMMNPPFLKAGCHTPAPNARKATANSEKPKTGANAGAALSDWLGCAARLLRPRGRLALIHRADRIDHVLTALTGHDFGAIALFPLWPRRGAPARRILIQARHQARSPASILPGLILHENDGRFTAAADAVLRDAQGLLLGAS